MTNQDRATYSALGSMRAVVSMRRRGLMSDEAAWAALEAEADTYEQEISQPIEWRAEPYAKAEAA